MTFYLPCGTCDIDLEKYDGLTIYCHKCNDTYCELCFGEEFCLQCENKEEEIEIKI